MESEKLPLRQAFFGLIFATLFVIVGAIAVSASYDNKGSGGSYGTEESDHSEESDSHDGDEEDHDG